MNFDPKHPRYGDEILFELDEDSFVADAGGGAGDQGLVMKFEEECWRIKVMGDEGGKAVARSAKTKHSRNPVQAKWHGGIFVSELESWQHDIKFDGPPPGGGDVELPPPQLAEEAPEDPAAAKTNGAAEKNKTPFLDKEFPPNASSLGPSANPFDAADTEACNAYLEKQYLDGSLQNAKWIRAPTLLDPRAPIKLYDSIVPNDIRQGSIGDCYALAAIAAVAEFPDFVKGNLIQESTLSKRGKYTGKFYDFAENKWVEVVVDDFLPCYSRKSRRRGDENYLPLMAKSNGNELWVQILEKMCAKFCGSYSHLGNGGCAILTLMCMTGCRDAFVFRIDDPDPGKVTRFQIDMACLEQKPRVWRGWKGSYNPDDSVFDREVFWTKLKQFDKANFPMCCSFKKATAADEVVAQGEQGEAVVKDGLVRGHA